VSAHKKCAFTVAWPPCSAVRQGQHFDRFALRMAEHQNSSALHRFALATCGGTVLLLMAGALVTSNDAADSVPDWPLAYGKIIPPLIGGIRYEYAHRVLAGMVAILTTILAIWITRASTRNFVRRLGWSAFALVLLQALLGAARVLEGHPPLIATIHATVAQIFFITTVALAYYTGAGAADNAVPGEDSGAPRVTTLGLWTTGVILVQLVLGAGFRHGAFGILPHLIGAGVVTLMVIWTGRTAKSRFGNVPEIRGSIVFLHATFGTQILLGFAAYWAVAKALSEPQPTMSYVVLTVAHVLVGALVLAASVIFTLSSLRLTRRAIPVASGSRAERPAGSSPEGSRI
jgi:heme a synthase